MWYSLFPANELSAGNARTADVGNMQLAVFNVDGKFYALENSCPHQGGPLAEGFVEGKCVTCPWHGWEFDVTTGECPDMGEEVARFPVRVEDGTVQVEVN